MVFSVGRRTPQGWRIVQSIAVGKCAEFGVIFIATATPQCINEHLLRVLILRIALAEIFREGTDNRRVFSLVHSLKDFIKRDGRRLSESILQRQQNVVRNARVVRLLSEWDVLEQINCGRRGGFMFVEEHELRVSVITAACSRLKVGGVWRSMCTCFIKKFWN